MWDLFSGLLDMLPTGSRDKDASDIDRIVWYLNMIFIAVCLGLLVILGIAYLLSD